MARADNQIRWRRDRRDVICRVVGSVELAAAAHRRHVGHRGRGIGRDIEDQIDRWKRRTRPEEIGSRARERVEETGPPGAGESGCGQARRQHVGNRHGTAGAARARIGQRQRVPRAALPLRKGSRMRRGHDQIRNDDDRRLIQGGVIQEVDLTTAGNGRDIGHTRRGRARDVDRQGDRGIGRARHQGIRSRARECRKDAGPAAASNRRRRQAWRNAVGDSHAAGALTGAGIADCDPVDRADLALCKRAGVRHVHRQVRQLCNRRDVGCRVVAGIDVACNGDGRRIGHRR